MTGEQWQEVSDLFERALDVEPSRREPFLARACHDHQVHAAVRGLLVEDERLGDSLLNPLLDSLITPPLARSASDANAAGKYLGLKLKERYVLERELGSGGSSIVYLATDRVLPEKLWVVKILKEGSVDYEWFRKRFEQEIKALTLLDGHAGIVAVSDAGDLPDGLPYFVMPHVEGSTLSSEIKRGPMDFARVGHIVRQVGDALTFAHAKGIYHLDLKPGNIILQNTSNAQPRVWLIDFGTAKIKSPDPGARTEVTRLAGTPGYMAPEQFVGRPSASSDVYALGIIAFEMLTGYRPSDHDFLQLDLVRTKKKVGELSHPLPEETQKAIARAVALEPAQRHGSPAEFGEALARSLSPVIRWQTLGRAGAFLTSLGRRVPSRAYAALLGAILVATATALLMLQFGREDVRTAVATPRVAPAAAPIIVDRVDELRQAYTARHETLQRNFLLQFVFVVIALLVAVRAGNSVKIPALGLTLPATWLCFVIPVVLLYLWLEFGFVLDDLIKWRAEAWTRLSEMGETNRASGFNDGGYIDGWFMSFRPLQHSIQTTFLLGSVFFFCLMYCPLLAANHACALILLFIGARRSLSNIPDPSLLHKVTVRIFPWLALSVLIMSHLQFRYGGPNPNWMQPVVGVLVLILAGLLLHHAHQRMRSQSTERVITYAGV